MSKWQGSPRRSRKHRVHVHKPQGVLHPRVQKVGPERFGIVCVDCAKSRSKWMLADFYGKILASPETVEHNAQQLQAMVGSVRREMTVHHLADCIVVVERTGQYHLPVYRAFKAADFETRILHPFATKQFRQAADPAIKTDDNDLAAIQRASVNGFGLIEQTLDPLYARLRLLVRHRRDLVQKASALRCQIREHLGAAMPGYAELFDKLFETDLAMLVARETGSAAAVLQQGVDGLARIAGQAKVRFQRPSLEKIVAWAGIAAPADPQSALQRDIWTQLEQDYRQKRREIQHLEGQIATCLVQTPYILLLAIPGLNVVTSGDLAGELGPITDYANANAITGRAGIYPARYQSDQVDRQGGPLVRISNRRLRAALLRAADCLLKCNDHFRLRAQQWKLAGKDPRYTRVRIASAFSRILVGIVGSGELHPHPCLQNRDYILDKLFEFQRQHDIPMSQRIVDLNAVLDQIPKCDYRHEAQPWQQRQQKLSTVRRHGPTPVGELVTKVLARLVGKTVQSEASGDQSPS